MKCRKFMILLCLFCYFCLSVHSQELVFKPIDWNALDNNLNMLEWNLQQLKTDNMNSQKYSDEMAKFSASQALQLQEYESKLRTSEKATKRWRNCCLVLAPLTCITTTTAVALILRNR